MWCRRRCAQRRLHLKYQGRASAGMLASSTTPAQTADAKPPKLVAKLRIERLTLIIQNLLERLGRQVVLADQQIAKRELTAGQAQVNICSSSAASS